jgi:hypothetical protein
VTFATQQTLTGTETAETPAKGPRPTHRVWLVQGEKEQTTWTEIAALWPTKKGNGLNGAADKLLPILANHIKGRVVVLPAKFKPEGQPAGGAQ